MHTGRSIKFLTIFLSLLSWPSICLSQAGLRISPPVVDVVLGRGGVKVFSFELANDNKESPLEFIIFPLDLDMDRAGAVEFLDIGKSDYSCSRWIKVEPRQLIIGPGKIKKVIAKLSVPASAKPRGYYSAVVCELVTKKSRKADSTVTIKRRIASLIKVTVLGGRLEKKATLEDFFMRTLFEAEEEKNKGLTFLSSLQNQGNIHIQAEGKLTVLTLDRRRKGEVDFDMGTKTILPGHTRDFMAVYDRFLPEGDYIARAVFRYGSARSLEKEIQFSVKAAQPSEEQEEGVAVLPSFRLIPESFIFKIPSGGFRTAGLTVQNQRQEAARIKISLNKEALIRGWFQFEPEALTLEGGKEAKVLIKINIPEGAKEGVYKGSIELLPFLISAQGQEELDAESIEVNLEIPKF